MKNLLLTFAYLIQFNLLAQPTQKIVSLFFTRNSSLIAKDDLAKIDTLITKIKKNELIPLNLVAYCDTFGSGNANLRLAMLRIDAVKKILSDNSIPIPTADAKGENYPVNTENYSDYAFWRRVDIECAVVVKPTKEVVAIKIKEREKAPENVSLALPKSKRFDKKITDEPVNLNIQFYPGEARLWNTFSYKEVDDLYAFLIDNMQISVLIRGHVCCENDMKLSLARAKAVYDILIARGIEKERLDFRGFGNTLPISIENSDDNRQKNRRVDVIFSNGNELSN